MGRPAVVLSVTKQPHVNTLELTERLHDTLQDIADSLPDGVSLRLGLFYYRAAVRCNDGSVHWLGVTSAGVRWWKARE